MRHYSHPQLRRFVPVSIVSSSNSPLSGGKNSSTGKDILSNKSHGLSSVAPIHSFCGTQKSYAGISSITLRSSLIIENIPIDTKTLFCSPPKIRLSSNTRLSESGILARSKSSSQQHLSFTSATFAPSAIGSTTSAFDYKLKS